jgi:hypothetical protein
MRSGKAGVEPFLADPALPGLVIAGDPDAMRDVFQRHLRSFGRPHRLRYCRLFRVRYRRADRCVLQYTLGLVEPDTGRERSEWVTGVMHAGDRTRRIWDKLQSADLGTIPDAVATLEPFSFVPDLGMLVQAFPYDRRLPTLPLLMSGPPPELEPSLLARFGRGDWQTEAWNVEPVRYRAGLGATLRLTTRARNAATGEARDGRFYVKIYRDEEEGEQTHRTLRAFGDEVDGEGFGVGRPIVYSGDLRALLQEEAPGVSLQEILQNRDGSVPARQAAAALAALHLGRAPTTRRHRSQDEVAAIARTGNLLRWACPHLEERVSAAVGAVTADLGEAPTGPTHRDLKPEHILLNGDRPYLLDLDWFAEADPLLDSAGLLAGLASMPMRFDVPRERPLKAARAFAGEYFARVPRAWRDRLPVHYAGAVLKEAVGSFRRQEPGWSDKIAVLVREAEDSLAGELPW